MCPTFSIFKPTYTFYCRQRFRLNYYLHFSFCQHPDYPSLEAPSLSNNNNYIVLPNLGTLWFGGFLQFYIFYPPTHLLYTILCSHRGLDNALFILRFVPALFDLSEDLEVEKSHSGLAISDQTLVSTTVNEVHQNHSKSKCMINQDIWTFLNSIYKSKIHQLDPLMHQ